MTSFFTKMKSERTSSIIFGLSFLVSMAAIIGISRNSLFNLPSVWDKEEYSHGVLIPLISLFIGWHVISRDKPELMPNVLGIIVIIVSLLMSALSELSAFQALLNYSFIIGLFGISLAFFGRKFTASITPALIFLLFAVPLPNSVFSNLSIQMQLVSSTLGTHIIQLLGYSVYQDGNIIDLGHMKLQVVEACNGLRYLFPLMSLGFLMAYLMEDKWWKRLIVFISVVPITIFMNSSRIAMVGVTVNIWGADVAEGVLHVLEGFVVFGICLTILLAEVFLLLRFSARGRFRDEYLGLPKGPIFSGAPKITLPVIVSTLLCVCTLFLFNSGTIKNRLENTPVAVDFASFPVQIDDWYGKRDFLNSAELEMLNLSDYWIAEYTNKETTAPVGLYIAFYNSQRMRASIHMPLNCIVGSGWEVAEQSKMSISTSEGPIPVVRMVARKQNEAVLIYYWLEQRGRRINDITKAKLFLAYDSITMHRTDGALVRFTTPLIDGEDIAKSEERIMSFIESAHPLVKKYVPGR